jgi:O-antigen ligase
LQRIRLHQAQVIANGVESIGVRAAAILPHQLVRWAVRLRRHPVFAQHSRWLACLKAPFGRSTAGLSLAALLGPFWLTQFGPSASFTVGTGLIVVVAVLVSLDLLRYRPPVKALAVRAFVPAFAMCGLVLWAFVNASLWGCLCGGFHGLADLTGAALLALAVGAFAPGRRALVLAGAAGGVVFAGILAVAGVKTLHSPFGNTAASTSTQLSGIYGNPNYLGYAVAFAIPVVLAWIPRNSSRMRLILLPVLLFAVMVVALTFSRGALLATGAGGLVTLTMLAPSRRMRAAVLVGGLSVAAAVAALAFPSYNEYRKRAVFGTGTVQALKARDASGWDGGPQGLISNCCSTLSNLRGGAVLRILASQPNEGVSRAWGVADAGRSYELRFKARSFGRDVLLSYGLEDNMRGNGTVVHTTGLSPAWRRLRLRWVPTRRSLSARLYVWQTQGRSVFLLSNIRVITRSVRHGTLSSQVVPTELAGFPGSSGPAELDKKLSSYVDERLTGIRLAAEAFAANPMRGIGWEAFPRYADAHGSGEIPTHNEYLRIASELGAPGIFFVTLLGFATFRGLARVRGERRLRAAGAGVIAVGCVGLLFVNGLTVSAASLPLALAVGLMCAPALAQQPTG